MKNYAHRGARALVLLHERALREFVSDWREASAAGVQPPSTTGGGDGNGGDPNYRSLDTILRHVFRAARGYMTWTCRTLDLADPEIRDAPEVEALAEGVQDHLEHLLECWALPLADVSAHAFDEVSAASSWGRPLV